MFGVPKGWGCFWYLYRVPWRDVWPAPWGGATAKYLEIASMKPVSALCNSILLFCISITLVACSSGHYVTRVQSVPESADVPYQNILVVALLSTFDARKGLENAVVKDLTSRGIKAVASTSMMTTKTPITKSTFVAMVDELGSDGLLVSHLVAAESKVRAKDANPQRTINVRPTYYFNVWNVQVTEYVEPTFVGVEASFVLATEMYSVRDQEAVWAIESNSDFVQEITEPRPYLVYIDEAQKIVGHMASDGVIAQ